MRPHFVSGTHTLACALFGNLRHGDKLISVAGEPYDTMQEVIGLTGCELSKRNSLIGYGIKYDEVIAIGPVPMMKFVCKVTEPYGIKTIVSLNPIMVDGTGMCGGCRVTVDGKIRYACVEGPDFDGHKVDFDELMRRNATYRDHEKSHICNLTGEVR